MSNDKKQNFETDARKQERDAYLEKELHNHGLMLKGKAGGLIIETNAATPNDENNPYSKRGQEKKHREAMFRKMLDDIQQALNDRLRGVRKGISAAEKIKDLYKKGELDPDNAWHAILLDQAGLSMDDINSTNGQAIDDRIQDLVSEENEIEQDLKIINEIDGMTKDAITPEAEAKLNKLFEDNADNEDIYALGKAYKEGKTEMLADATGGDFSSDSGFDTEFSDFSTTEVSFAKTADTDGGIKAKSPKGEFNMASSGEKVVVADNGYKPEEINPEALAFS